MIGGGPYIIDFKQSARLARYAAEYDCFLR